MTQTRRTFLHKLAAAGAALTLSRVLLGALADAATTGRSWASGMALNVSFTVATQARGRVKRPFVAIWIEDETGKTVRNLTTWVDQNELNPRWLAELRRWTRQNSNLVGTVSSATRKPGSYAVQWDGKTDARSLARQGNYFVCIETAREDGPYSLVREKVTVGSAAFKKVLGVDNDIEAASVAYGRA